MEKRKKDMDVVKGIGIFLVVVGHLEDSESISLLKTIIYSFHMPLFFYSWIQL